MLVKIIITFILFLNLVSWSFSQDKEMNLLYEKIQTQPEKQLDNIEKLRVIYLSQSLDSLYSLGNYTLQHGIDQDNYGLMILGKLILSSYYSKVGKADLSITYLEQCIFYYKQKNDLVHLADAENLMGVSYLKSNNHPKAIQYLVRSIETSKNLSDDKESFQAQLNLSELYLRDGQLDLAESEALNYLDRVKKLNLQNAIKRSYDVLGKIYIAKQDMDLGFSYFQKGLELALKGNSSVLKAHSYNNIAIAYFENGDFSLAKENFKKALRMRIKIKDLVGVTESYYNLGDWHYFQELYADAIPLYLKSLSAADSNNLLKESADAMYKIALSYEAIGNYKLASEYYSKNIDAIQEINLSQRTKQLDMQRAAYELQRKEDQLLQSKREKTQTDSSDKQRNRAKLIIIIFSILTSGLLLLYLFTILKRNFNKENQTEKIDLKLEQGIEVNEYSNKWELLERFIHSEEKMEKRETSYFNGKIRFTSQVQLYELDQECILFWETNSSSLESYIFNNYIHSKIKDIRDLPSFSKVIHNQELIQPQKITFGLIYDQEEKVLVCGNNGLVIQNENKMSFMTENKLDVKDYSVFVSENLKNYLIENEMWDKFLNQIDMTTKMSSNMALTTLEDSWSEIFESNQLGVFIIQPTV